MPPFANIAGPELVLLWAGAIGGTLTTVGGATIGLYFLFRKKKREDDGEEDRAALDRRKRADAAERTRRKDTIDELYRILEAQKDDLKEQREEIHGLRGELGVVKTSLAVAETRLNVCEDDRLALHAQNAEQQRTLDDYRTAMEAAGIKIPRRPEPKGVP